MSADNWGICPKCKKSEAAKLKSAYGVVSEVEYLAMLRIAKDAPKETLREDYEIYTDQDGEFVVAYVCSCDKCGFRFSFDHSVNVLEGEHEKHNPVLPNQD